ncbi:MAG: glycosyltransferase, partial [bacterium]|nr:glycosyltransferase [bacterium]
MPGPQFDHLRRLTNHLGVWEHAHFTTPRPEHGYCTDDNARALIVICRQPEASAGLVQLAEIYLTFLEQAFLPGGGFHNRRRWDGAWADKVGSDDAQGRALWALGSVAHRGPTPAMCQVGLHLFARNSEFDSPFPRANAYAVLGAAEMVQASPDHEPAWKVLERCAGRIPVVPHDARWPWPEERLTYDNARIPEALLAAGACTGDDSLLDTGLRLLEWLVATETRTGGCFSFTPVGGWTRGE